MARLLQVPLAPGWCVSGSSPSTSTNKTPPQLGFSLLARFFDFLGPASFTGKHFLSKDILCFYIKFKSTLLTIYLARDAE